ncbi:MAG: DUF3566 domain-containing protein [Burkholderiales bacterium]|nr:DUF3566 domain-containing protein [Anaerolineae bacterium]
MITVKRVSVGSAFKVGAIVSLIISAITGLCFALFAGSILTTMSSIATSINQSGGTTTSLTQNDLAAFNAAGLTSLCISVGIQMVVAAIGGGLFSGLLAIAYNLTARWVGGLEVELHDDGYGFNAPVPPPSQPRYNPYAGGDKAKRHPNEGFDA